MNNRKLNIDIQKLFYSVTPLLCCLVLLAVMFPVSAYAVEFVDYNDFISDIVIDGENDLVTCYIPVDYSFIKVYSDGEYLGGSQGDGRYSFTASESPNSYIIDYDYFDPVRLMSSNIPNGTSITFTYTVFGNVATGYTSPTSQISLTYRNSSSVDIGSSVVDLGYFTVGEPQTASIVVDKRVATVGLSSSIRCTFNNSFVGGQQVIFEGEPLKLQMSISSLYRLQEETGKTNELLQLVLEKLGQIEQENLNWFERIWKAITDGFNAVLDAIGNIIGISEEDKQAAEDFKNDAIDKSEKLEGAVDAMGSVNKPPADQVQAGMDSMLPSDGGNYVSQTMNVVVGIPLVTEQLSIVVIIMFASFVLFGKKEA